MNIKQIVFISVDLIKKNCDLEELLILTFIFFKCNFFGWLEIEDMVIKFLFNITFILEFKEKLIED